MVDGVHGVHMDRVVKLAEEAQESVADYADLQVQLMVEKTVKEHRQSQSLVISNYVQVSIYVIDRSIRPYHLHFE